MTNIEEIWSVIPDYPRYSVSNHARVKRNDTERILKPYIGNTGYYYIDLAECERRQNKTVHRLVAKAFIDNPENKHFVNHKDGIKTNSYVGNLEWCTRSENGIHAFKMGMCKIKKGIENHCCIFDATQVKTIRSVYGHFSNRKIAKYFNTSHSVVGRIVKKIGYSDVI